MIKTIALLLLILFLGIFHLAVFTSGDAFGLAINLPLVALFLLTMYRGFRQGIAAGIILGILYDIYSVSINGTYLIAWTLPVLVTFLLAKNVFTNRSTLSFIALSALATLNFLIALILVSHGAYLLGLSRYPFPFSRTIVGDMGLQLVLNTGIVLLLIHGTRIVKTRLSTRFLLNRRT